MADIIRLSDNPFSGAERTRLESFGAYSVASGRALHWQWAAAADGSEVFEICRGSNEEVLVTRISRVPGREFQAQDVLDGVIASGALEQVLARLERYLSGKQERGGYDPDPAA
jgi:hypothetical protein